MLGVSEPEVGSGGESLSTSAESCSEGSEDDAEMHNAKRLSLESNSPPQNHTNAAASTLLLDEVALLVDSRERTSDGTTRSAIFFQKFSPGLRVRKNAPRVCKTIQGMQNCIQGVQKCTQGCKVLGNAPRVCKNAPKVLGFYGFKILRV